MSQHQPPPNSSPYMFAMSNQQPQQQPMLMSSAMAGQQLVYMQPAQASGATARPTYIMPSPQMQPMPLANSLPAPVPTLSVMPAQLPNAGQPFMLSASQQPYFLPNTSFPSGAQVVAQQAATTPSDASAEEGQCCCTAIL